MSTARNRFVVVLVGVAVGMTLTALATITQLPAQVDWEYRLSAWGVMMGGPIVGTALGMDQFHCFVSAGWLGLPMILAHPLKPQPATAWLTMIGLVCWFGSGFLTIIVMVWGA